MHRSFRRTNRRTDGARLRHRIEPVSSASPTVIADLLARGMGPDSPERPTYPCSTFPKAGLSGGRCGCSLRPFGQGFSALITRLRAGTLLPAKNGKIPNKSLASVGGDKLETRPRGLPLYVG